MFINVRKCSKCLTIQELLKNDQEYYKILTMFGNKIEYFEMSQEILNTHVNTSSSHPDQQTYRKYREHRDNQESNSNGGSKMQ